MVRIKRYRRTFLNVLILGLVLAIVSAGAIAYLGVLNGVESTYAAGTLNLTVGGGGPAANSFEVTGILPGGNGNAASWQIKNNGTESGLLSVSFANVTDEEHLNPESETETSELNGGELAEYLTVFVYLDVTDDDEFLAASDDVLIYGGKVSGIEGQQLTGYVMDANQTEEFRVDYRLPETVDNMAQGDRTGFDVFFVLVGVSENVQ